MKEDEWIFVPKNEQIKQVTTGNGKKDWDFPVGTEIVHRVFFSTDEKPLLFEFRIMKKLLLGDWAFGVYVDTGSASSELTLLTDNESKKKLKMSVLDGARRLTQFGVHFPLEITASHTDTKSCRMCHDEPHGRFKCERLAGPCGLTPDQISVKQIFESNFYNEFKKSPFQN